MIVICPHCQHPNPSEAQVCEQCGSSLVEQVCFNCDAKVSFTQENCHNCGAATGKTWRAIIIPREDKSVSTDSFSDYLDVNQRYRIIADLSLREDTSLTTRVLDCQPLVLPDFQLSPIQFSDTEDTESESTTQDTPITPLAQLYLSLREKLPDLIPEIHDSWCDQNWEYLLLEDRGQWQNISKIEDLPTLQILAYLKQMTALWPEFSQQQVNRTFLNHHNLFLDEDECFVVQEIYQNQSPEDENIANLGQLWQTVFNTTESVIATLYAQMIQGEISTITQLRTAIEEIEVQLDAKDYFLPSLVLPQSLVDETNNDDDDSEIITDPSDEDDLPTLVLPMQLLSVSEAAITDIGQQREHNEDYYGIITKTDKNENPKKTIYNTRGLYIVCDGMGGHAAGEVASRMAVECLQDYLQQHWGEQLPTTEVIRQGILLTNQKIYQENLQYGRSGSGRMGTTMVMVLIHNTEAAIAHVGDSRVYHITRKKGLTQITLDHAVGQQEILCGVEPEIAYGRHDAYQLTQAIGPRDNSCVHPEIQLINFKEDTILFLCSDGFSDNNFIETEGKPYLMSVISSKANLEQELKQLLDAANLHNGHDNLTGILIRVKVQPSLERG